MVLGPGLRDNSSVGDCGKYFNALFNNKECFSSYKYTQVSKSINDMLINGSAESQKYFLMCQFTIDLQKKTIVGFETQLGWIDCAITKQQRTILVCLRQRKF